LNTRRSITSHNEAFGRALAELRKSKKLSQERLGFEADMDRSFISLMERGKRSPTLDTLVSLCAVLEISLSDFAALIEARQQELFTCSGDEKSS